MNQFMTDGGQLRSESVTTFMLNSLVFLRISAEMGKSEKRLPIDKYLIATQHRLKPETPYKKIKTRYFSNAYTHDIRLQDMQHP